MKKKAQNECANWSLGNCIGCNVYIDKGYLDRNKWSPVFLSIDSKKSGKPCTVEKGCDYFNKFVIQK